MKVAMKQNDTLRKNTIKCVISAIKNQIIDNKDHKIDEYGVYDIYDKLIKQRTDSIANFAANGRTELVDKEQNELSILKQYKDQLKLFTDDVKEQIMQLVNEKQHKDPAIKIGNIFKQVNLDQLSEDWKTPVKAIKKGIIAQISENKEIARAKLADDQTIQQV